VIHYNTTLISHLTRSCSTGWLGCKGTRITSIVIVMLNTSREVTEPITITLVFEAHKIRYVSLHIYILFLKGHNNIYCNFCEGYFITHFAYFFDLGFEATICGCRSTWILLVSRLGHWLSSLLNARPIEEKAINRNWRLSAIQKSKTSIKQGV